MPRRVRTRRGDSTDVPKEAALPECSLELVDVLRHHTAYEPPPRDMSPVSQVPTPDHLLSRKETSDSCPPMTTQVPEGHQPLQRTDQDTIESPLETDLLGLDNELKRKQKDLDAIDSFYQNWKSLKAKLAKSKKNLKKTSTHIEKSEQRKRNIEGENIKIGRKLKSLQISTLRQQEKSLESLRSEGVSSSTQEIVDGLLKRIATEKSVIGVKECVAITNLKEKYERELEKSLEYVETIKRDMSEILIEFGIEIDTDIIDTYIHEGEYHPLENAKECTERLATTYQRIFSIESGQTREKANRESNEKWVEMIPTRFYQQKVEAFHS